MFLTIVTALVLVAGPNLLGMGCISAHASQVYGLEIYPYPTKFISFDTSSPGTQTTINGSFTPTQIFAMDFNPAATILYGVDYGTLDFGTIDTTSGTFTKLNTVTGISGSVTGLKTDPTSSLFYLSTTDISQSFLYTLNIATGVVTLVGSQSVAPALIDIAIDSSGQMYGTDIVNDAFYSIDKSTGAAALIGNLRYYIDNAQGMYFAYSSGILYAALFAGFAKPFLNN